MNFPHHSFDLDIKKGKVRGECLLTGNSPFWFDVKPSGREVKCWHCGEIIEPPWHLYELKVSLGG